MKLPKFKDTTGRYSEEECARITIAFGLLAEGGLLNKIFADKAFVDVFNSRYKESKEN